MSKHDHKRNLRPAAAAAAAAPVSAAPAADQVPDTSGRLDVDPIKPQEANTADLEAGTAAVAKALEAITTGKNKHPDHTGAIGTALASFKTAAGGRITLFLHK